jgi:hypothetical protein
MNCVHFVLLQYISSIYHLDTPEILSSSYLPPNLLSLSRPLSPHTQVQPCSLTYCSYLPDPCLLVNLENSLPRSTVALRFPLCIQPRALWAKIHLHYFQSLLSMSFPPLQQLFPLFLRNNNSYDCF